MTAVRAARATGQALTTAAERFETMRMEAFARRARVEVAATTTGSAAARVVPAVSSPRQAMRVAQLVAEGSTNREIAMRLFISGNTVEYHLKKALRKMGVSSRTQLARALLTRSPLPGDQHPR